MRADVPKKILQGEFDWTKEETGYFRYNGTWYHLSQFMRLPKAHEWQGYHSDSAWTGIFIRVSSDGETFQVGTYTN